MARKTTLKKVESLRHPEANRKNIPTAEYRAVMADDERRLLEVAYERRNRDLDPQFVWRGKDQQDPQDLIVQAPPLYIQEKVHPKVLIDDLVRHSRESEPSDEAIDLFADFNGLPDEASQTEFYRHEANWSNRMILGDSLQVMASLAEREDLRGKVQCIYVDPPYGIKFNSNFQWSTTSRDVRDGNRNHITREPEQVKAFRDTWRDGVHSYLTYLRDRLTVARDLLSPSGSIFVQIGEENVHRVRAVMDEVFGEENFVVQLILKKTGTLVGRYIESINDYILWFAKNKDVAKYRRALREKTIDSVVGYSYVEVEGRLINANRASSNELKIGRYCGSYPLHSQGYRDTTTCNFEYQGRKHHPGMVRNWKVAVDGLVRLGKAGRIIVGTGIPRFKRYFDDFAAVNVSNNWSKTFTASNKIYVVQTSSAAIQRCLLMTTDPGDLVLDPTCGSGTTAYVAEQWGRRWITIDTSRVALALARARVMGARYPYYLLADSPEGQRKEAQITRKAPSDQPTYGRVRQGFVYKRVPHITLKQIANNAEIDVIWEQHQETLEPLREKLNARLGTAWEEWEIPRNPKDSWDQEARKLHGEWWKACIARQQEIDASIAVNAPFEYLYDKPYEDKRIARVAGPFTVESLSPHRVFGVGADDELLDRAVDRPPVPYGEPHDFAGMILDQLRTAGVQQAQKSDRIDFTALTGWPGRQVCAEGRYVEGNRVRRAGILIGPEFGTVSRPDLAAAAREAAEAGFDTLIACAFNYDAQSANFGRLGQVPILKARMNADLHMAEELKNTGKGNLFVVFGEPDIEIHDVDDGQIQVEIRGIDIFHPATGKVRSHDTEGIACWFIDTDYNEESFFVRHAYFPGINDPYKALKTTLKAEINDDAWDTLRKRVSRPFAKPASGRIAVKAINRLGDEAMRVFRV